jgi:hypothetical protein
MDIHIDFLKADSVRNAQPAFTHAPGFDFEKFYTDVIKPYINEDLKEQGKMDICQILDLCEVKGTYGVELGNQTEGDLHRLHFLAGPSDVVLLKRRSWMNFRRRNLPCTLCKKTLVTRHRQFWKRLPNGHLLCMQCATTTGHKDTLDPAFMRYSWPELTYQLCWDSWDAFQYKWDSDKVCIPWEQYPDHIRYVLQPDPKFDQKLAYHEALLRCSLYHGDDLKTADDDKFSLVPWEPAEPKELNYLVPKWYLSPLVAHSIVNDLRDVPEEELTFINVPKNKYRIDRSVFNARPY